MSAQRDVGDVFVPQLSHRVRDRGAGDERVPWGYVFERQQKRHEFLNRAFAVFPGAPPAADADLPAKRQVAHHRGDFYLRVLKRRDGVLLPSRSVRDHHVTHGYRGRGGEQTGRTARTLVFSLFVFVVVVFETVESILLPKRDSVRRPGIARR